MIQGYHLRKRLQRRLNKICLVLFQTVPIMVTFNFKGSDRQSEVVELSMQYCAQIL